MNFLSYYYNAGYNSTMEKIARPIEDYEYDYLGIDKQLRDQPVQYPTEYLNSTRRHRNKLVNRLASGMDREVTEISQDTPWNDNVASFVGAGSLGALGGGLGYGLAKNKWLGAGLSAGAGALLGAILGRNTSKQRTGHIENARAINRLDTQKRQRVLRYLAEQDLEDTRKHARARQVGRG